MKEGWEYKKLGEVCQITMGQSPAGNSINENEGIEFHQGKTCFGDRFLGFSALYSNSPLRIAEPNSVLLCVRAPVGFPNITDRKVCIGRGVCALMAKEILDNNFLYYSLLGKQSYFEKNATGSTFKAISSKVVSNTPIAIPSKSVQLAIVAELDQINDLIRLKKEQLKEYDNLAQSIFYDMFGDPVENEKGWEVKKLGELSEKLGDGLHGTPIYCENSGYYFVNGNNLESGTVVYTDKTRQVPKEEYLKYFIEFGKQTLFVSINGTIGKLAYYSGEKIILGKSACYINLRPEVNKVFVYNILASNYFRKYTLGEKTGSTISNVSLKSMRNFPVPLPPLPLQQEFSSRIEQIEKLKTEVQKTITDLETLLASRMQYWFE